MLKFTKEVPTVSLMTVNLHRLGIRVALARLTCNNGKAILMTRKTNERRASKLDLFTTDFHQGLEQTCSFNFQVYVEGLLDTYAYQQYDQLLDDQLWATVRFCCWTDFKFLIGDNVFNVHKFVLAARSSRLAAELKHVDSIRLSDHLDVETFECFLHFLYTGKLELTNFNKTAADELLMLADEYGVETLKQLCSAGIEKLKADNFPERFMSTGPPVTGPNPSSLIHEPRYSQIYITLNRNGLIRLFGYLCRSETNSKPDSVEIRFTLEIDQLPEPGENLIKSVKFRNDKVFHVSFRSACSEESKRNHAFFIFTKIWPEGGLEISEILAHIYPSSAEGKPSRTKRFNAIKWGKVAGLNPAMDVFSIDVPECHIQTPFTTLFQIDLSCKSIGKYSYVPRDTLMAKDLWSASVDGKLTDTDIIVDGRTFRVHKALLAARSPVLNNRFYSANNNRIVLEDIEAEVFEEVLYFIYTGFLRVPANQPKLFAAAVKYQIETLKFLCENQVELLNRSLEDLCSFLQMVTS